jgi:hypothetical protein
VPAGFVKPRWRPHVFSSSGVDRHFYELCALAERRDRLRSGDIWVTGSRQCIPPKIGGTSRPVWLLCRRPGCERGALLPAPTRIRASPAGKRSIPARLPKAGSLIPCLRKFTFGALAAAFTFGIGTLWIEALWPFAVFQAAVVSTACLWFCLASFTPQVRLSPWLALPFLVVALGTAQFMLGGTENRWQTRQSVFEWAAHGIRPFRCPCVH